MSLLSFHSSDDLNPAPLRPSVPSLLGRINDFRHNLGDIVQEWTPFLLVASYFVFSTCLYMVCSSVWISAFWFIYLFTNTYIAGATVVEALQSLAPEKEARKAILNIVNKGWQFPTPDDQLLVLDLIIVAYLPNEKDIILQRIHYACTRIMYPEDKIRINVVYNTPVPIESLESEMVRLTKEYSQLRVMKVPHSHSKADNLNYFCSLETRSDVIAVFDCDHYTHPYAPRWAIERMISDSKIDIVQGRCIVQNAGQNLQTALIAVEFDKIYAVSHPGRAAMFGFGLFCGSNGFWRSSLLRRLKMDGNMLTEDIDSALRAFSYGANAVHDLNVTSYELAPTTLSAFWKQRLRWSQGWAQATGKHAPLIWRKTDSSKPKRNFRQRFGMLSLLYIRESSYYLVTQYFCVVVSVVITQFPNSGSQLLKLLFFQYPVAYWLLIISAICLGLTLHVTFRVRSDYVRPWMMLVFSVLYPGILLLNAVLGLYGHARQVAKYVKWNPTPRG